MNSYEKQEIANLPDKYKPIGAWGYFGLTILFNIPIIGFICLLIFAFSGSNINRRSFARSYFCGLIIVLIAIVAIIVLAGGFEVIMDFIQQYIPTTQQ